LVLNQNDTNEQSSRNNGSISDMPVMQEAIEILKEFDIEIEVDIVSAQNS
jgi:phosphoribosylcarboxyaminoimidazole (NCAIR) mutase